MNELYLYNYITRYLRMQLNHTQGYHAIIITCHNTDLIFLQILSDRLQYCKQNDLTDPHVSIHLPYVHIPGNTISISTAHGPKESQRWCIRTVLRDTDNLYSVVQVQNPSWVTHQPYILQHPVSLWVFVCVELHHDCS